MIRPRPMKYVEIFVLSRDVDLVIEYLGRKALLHVSRDEQAEERMTRSLIRVWKGKKN